MIVTCPCCSVTRLRVERLEDAEGYHCERNRNHVRAVSPAHGEVLAEPAPPLEVVTVTDTPVSCPEPRPGSAHEIRADAGNAPVPPPQETNFVSRCTCGAPIPPRVGRGRRARFCSSACRWKWHRGQKRRPRLHEAEEVSA
jgi:hypothetical protein